MEVIMKKFLYIIFTFLLTFLFIGVDAKTIYLRECEYTKEYKKWLSLSEKERKNTVEPIMCKNDIQDKFTLVGSNGSNLNSASINDSVFNLVDYGYVTSVKNQGETGSCWAFATNASIESNLLVNGKGTYDLSEAHLELATQNTYKYNRLTFNRKISSGGNYYLSSAYLRNNWGPVLESSLPFNELEEYLSNKVAVSEEKVLNNEPLFNVNSITMLGNAEGSCSSDNIKDIKEYLITNGALTAQTYYGATSSFNLYQYYNGESYQDLDDNTVESNQKANHGITIVGWDDTISKDNFTAEKKPTRDGAFIIKNSYGEYQEIDLSEYKNKIYNELTETFNEHGIYSADEISNDVIINFVSTINNIDSEQIEILNGKIRVYVGNLGYQYVSYDDIYICNSVVGFFDVDSNVSDNVYGYDDLGVNGALQFYSDTAYLASVFTKKSDGPEKLTTINIYFHHVGQKYEIYFANGDTRQLSKMDLVATGTSDFVGYKTISINNKIITDDKYSIVVKISATDNVAIGGSRELIQFNNLWQDIEMVEGVQYVSNDGITYGDTQDAIRGVNFHLLIKAYTNDVDELNDEENNNGNNSGSGDIVLPPSEDDNKNDETNEDGKIEILPNEMNNPNGTNNESGEPNPSTGDNGLYVFICAGVILSIGFISYRKIKLSK
jgi:C1A family cysteine protease